MSTEQDDDRDETQADESSETIILKHSIPRPIRPGDEPQPKPLPVIKFKLRRIGKPLPLPVKPQRRCRMPADKRHRSR
jgi:hypothetical protein